ncbi:hypothetical protein VU01_10276 [Candidatus Electrothrix marina]|uniref:Uncharacterized protein n=1 Tax=Candidatus Electrothrix marina TaxID=1859130 RepID=A0A444JC90_9BACT|nr:hypothetical protein VT99_10165 [Candidatus Electrothrix marina]RWX50673.1 hypothetical protein VU00_10394 [Candidatus Electrothrix marina]RWX52225.1 hypothetical protein VU01_10276 [Candidatus Electrothrix marina]
MVDSLREEGYFIQPVKKKMFYSSYYSKITYIKIEVKNAGLRV